MQLNLGAFLAIIATCTLVVLTITIFVFDDPGGGRAAEWQHIELFVTSILVNVVMMALILKQMYEYNTDSRIRIRPWIGRAGDKKIMPQSPKILEMMIRNHGAVPAMDIEMFSLKMTPDRQLKFDVDREHNAFALAPSEEFGLSMDICDIKEVDSIIFDNEKVKDVLDGLKIRQGILDHFEKNKSDTSSDHTVLPWFGCIIRYTDPTRKIKGAYLVLGDYDHKTKNIAAEILLTM